MGISRLWAVASARTAVSLFALAAIASPASAKTEIQGDIHAVSVRVENASVDETLKALEASFGLRYRAPGSLVKSITGSYQGSLKDVVKRVLDGYDFVLTTRGTAIEIAVIGKSATPALAGSPNQSTAGVSRPAAVTVQPTPPSVAGIQVAALQAERADVAQAVNGNAIDGPVPQVVADSDPSKMPMPNKDGGAMPMPTPSASGDGPVPRPDMNASGPMPMPQPGTGNGPVPMPPTPVAQPADQPLPAAQPALAPKPN